MKACYFFLTSHLIISLILSEPLCYRVVANRRIDGRGQQELIIGDRQTGNTAVSTDTILNHKGRNDIATGSKTSSLAQVVNTFKDHGAMEYTIVVLETVNPPTTMEHYYIVNTLPFSPRIHDIRVQ